MASITNNYVILYNKRTKEFFEQDCDSPIIKAIKNIDNLRDFLHGLTLAEFNNYNIDSVTGDAFYQIWHDKGITSISVEDVRNNNWVVLPNTELTKSLYGL